MKLVGVVGAGQMGTGISHVCALSGFKVKLYDCVQGQVEKSIKTTRANLERQAKKGIISSDQIDHILENITCIKDLSELSDVDIAIEAATEKEEVKTDLFKKLDSIVKKEAILATNTSSISITKIAAATNRPHKVIGIHFMNPVPVMKLVEVIRGIATDENTFNETMELIKKLGKEAAVAKDYAGFIVNRILIPMINEAIFANYEGIGSIEDIDKAMKLGTNHPMGPFTLADFIGLDTVLYVMEVLYDNFKDPKFRPCPLLVKMVEAGLLGRKTGKGFYTYE